jgi:hypothetical protein
MVGPIRPGGDWPQGREPKEAEDMGEGRAPQRRGSPVRHDWRERGRRAWRDDSRCGVAYHVVHKSDCFGQLAKNDRGLGGLAMKPRHRRRPWDSLKNRQDAIVGSVVLWNRLFCGMGHDTPIPPNPPPTSTLTTADPSVPVDQCLRSAPAPSPPATAAALGGRFPIGHGRPSSRL